MTTGADTSGHEAPRHEKPKGGARDAIIEATMRLAARRRFEDVTITDIAHEAGVSLADFRDIFPSKGAVIGSFSRKIDRKVLDNLVSDYASEPARERIYDVLRHRLEALAPYRESLESIAHWAARDPLAASALNRETVNSMRFMLEAADIDCEGTAGALKLQGLAISWSGVLDAWFEDGNMSAALDRLERALERGAFFVDRADDLARLTQPLRWLASGLFNGFRSHGRKSHHDDEPHPHAEA